MVIELRDKPYIERLKILKLPSLQHRRKRGAAIEAFKILSGCNDPKSTRGVLKTRNRTQRGELLKIETSKVRLKVRQNSFKVRVEKIWNELPKEVTSGNLTYFKKQLDHYYGDDQFIAPERT